MDDWELIRAFRGGSDEAFAELVTRHAGLVWSAARRRLAGDEALAEDVVQKAFVLLARKAGSLKSGTSVSGWLYSTTIYLARETLRSEHRRRARETEAMLMSENAGGELEADWSEVEPVLEEAMLDLGEKDRAVILMRYFERRPFRELAAALGGTEDALKMRTSRALEKLRAGLERRGVGISAAALGVMLAELAVSAAPGAVLRLAAGAAAKSAAGWGSVTVKWMLMTTVQKTAMVTGVLLIAWLMVRRTTGPERSAGVPAEKQWALSMLTKKMVPRGAESGVEVSQGADARLERVMANLRAAIGDEWPNRRLPRERLKEALADFGAEWRAAIPVILEFLNAPRAERKLGSFVAAAYCLELLGTKGSSALPDVMKLLKAGDLALLNDGIPRLFAALSPDGAALPELIEALKEPPRGVDWVNRSIVELAEKNPSRVDQSRRELCALLNDERFGVRFNAATVLARLPGEKTPEALPILLEALGSKPVPTNAVELGSGTVMMVDPFWINERRRMAAHAIGEMGPAAAGAAAALLEIAETAPADSETELREYAMAALGKVDPSRREKSAEIDAELRRQERENELLKKAMGGTATFEENLEALRNRKTASAAAYDLARFPEARGAIPALVASIDQFENSEAVDLLKEIAPEVLVERVRERKLEGISDVAQALGELGPAMIKTAPDLRRILDETRPEEPARVSSIAEALRKIDPAQPKLEFNFEELHPAVSAFIGVVNEKGKVRSPAYDAYIRDFQDYNAVSRGHLLRFVASTQADPELHAVFVAKLLERFPDLRAEIGQ